MRHQAFLYTEAKSDSTRSSGSRYPSLQALAKSSCSAIRSSERFAQRWLPPHFLSISARTANKGTQEGFEWRSSSVCCNLSQRVPLTWGNLISAASLSFTVPNSLKKARSPQSTSPKCVLFSRYTRPAKRIAGVAHRLPLGCLS